MNKRSTATRVSTGGGVSAVACITRRSFATARCISLLRSTTERTSSGPSAKSDETSGGIGETSTTSASFCRTQVA